MVVGFDVNDNKAMVNLAKSSKYKKVVCEFVLTVLAESKRPQKGYRRYR